MFKILLNIFHLCHAPNLNEGQESGRFMIDMIDFPDIKRPLTFSVTCDVIKSKCSVSKLVSWQMTYMFFWIMFNVIWFREFCG